MNLFADGLFTQNVLRLLGYKLIESIYQGTKTLVYRALEPSSERSVVIKYLNQDYPSFGELVQFRNQYTITKNLSIPGIVRPLGLEPVGNSYALIMEDVGSVALSDYIQRQTLDVAEILAIARQLATILHDLHNQRVIHKDIKPANILIHPDTQQLTLIDFSIASLLPKETQSLQSPKHLEGTLAYLAPEQTGRMNRAIDYRTDFYSLGVTLYQILSSQLPFASDDPIEVIHGHIAQEPLPVDTLNPEIPAMVAALVTKLMAKNAEDRYQSALGLKYDVERCLEQWKAQGQITDFALGQRDVSDRFIIPEKLYGRERDVQTLLDAFDRVADGSSELMLVAGFSGIGKTAVVNEVHKPITQKKGYFIKGKFDQFNRNRPLSAFIQAFRTLVRQLLNSSDADLQHWKQQILAALGENAQVIIALIPELERILGPQPAVLELSRTAAQHRFTRLFQRFIQVFTTLDHPLVLFIDDLQWADSASLNLIQQLMATSVIHHLLLIGAYRDNEVPPTHPLAIRLGEIRKREATVNTILLPPLKLDSVNHWIADTLHTSTALAQPLTELVMQKTEGNPFFTAQFLRVLHQDHLLTFDRTSGYWQCDLAKVKAAALTNNVVEFMALQLQKLPQTTQKSLTLAACIGAEFDLETLAIVSEQSPETLATDLWIALQDELILPQSNVYKFYLDESHPTRHPVQETLTYKFLHDRVQQAAYSLMPEGDRNAAHLTIGRLLLANLPLDALNTRQIEIVNHLNYGLDLITSADEKIELSHLNIAAAQQASAATAYEAALDYWLTAADLLGPRYWQQNYDLAKTIYAEAANNAYLAGNLGQMEDLLKIAFAETHTLLDKIPLYEIKIQALVAQHDLQEAIELGLDTLAKLGVEFPNPPSPEAFQNGLADINRRLAGRPVSALIDLPEMTDPTAQAALKVLLRLSAVLVIASPQLMPFAFFTMVSLSIQKGNHAISALGYATYGMILCSAVGEIEAGYQFGTLAQAVLEQYSAKAVQAKTIARLNAGVWHWKDPLSTTLPTLAHNYQVALETGDLEYAAISAQVYANHLYFSGQELNQVDQELATYSDAVSHIQHKAFLYCIQAYHQLVLNLLGQSDNPQLLVGTAYDETVVLPHQYEVNDAHGVAVVHLFKGMACYLFGAYEDAFENFQTIDPFLRSIAPFTTGAAVPFFDSLSCLALMHQGFSDRMDRDRDRDRDALLARVAANQAKLEHWATHAPTNHLHRFHLVEAERYRVAGEKYKAMEFYDWAIAGAKEQGCQEEAIANELAATFYLDWGKEKVAAGYLQDAYYCYSRWGAKAKGVDLETRYPELLRPILNSSTTTIDVLSTFSTIAEPTLSLHSTTYQSSSQININQAFDLASLLQASQTLSSAIQLEELLRQLTQIILHNSGGDRCALILPTATHEWQVRAIATPEAIQLCSDPLINHRHVPVKLIQYVKNTQEVLVVEDTDPNFPIVDDYLLQQKPKSVLCLPILNQGHCIGVLYLNNQLTSGVFTKERILILNFLCTQAAIALENARLYQQEQRKSQEIAQKEAEYRSIFESVNDGLGLVDLTTGQTIAANPRMCQMHGYSQDEWLTLQPSDFIHASYVHEFINLLDVLNRGEEFYTQAVALHKDGHSFDVEVKSVPFVYQGKPHGLSVVRDISDRKRAEDAILQKTEALEHTLEKLKNTQLQLVQNEKMSALGNLVAGVAHEINNPVGCIIGNVSAAQDYIDDLLGLIDLYGQQFPEPGDMIEEELDTIDLEFVRDDLPKLIQAMQDGGKRIKSISRSLRTFSRADTETKQAFDIHEGLNSTVLILRHRLKANEQRPAIRVVKAYEKIPALACFPGQLNQVFMNILANAIDALDEASQYRSLDDLKMNPGCITIRTSMDNDQIKIAIADNGPGIPEEIKANIFDHLFTTKQVGKGTGLGLAIARQIVVDTHGGELDVQSEMDQGTHFCIRLPL